MSAPPAGVPASLARKVLVCFLPFACGYFLSFLYRSVNAVIGPQLTAELGLDAAQLGLLTSVFFAGFVLLQIPLGILLDRYGPRPVEAGLLLVACLGALLFVFGQDLTTLAVGRTLIGIGMSCGLMAAFKANVLYWPAQSRLSVNALAMAFGGLGAAAATLPVQIAADALGWRGMFAALAAITLASSAYVWFAAPRTARGPGERWRDQLRAVGTIIRSPVFARVWPLQTCAQAVWLSYQGLWAGPWLRDVAGLDHEAVAERLFLLAVAMIAGFIFSAFAADIMRRLRVASAIYVPVLVGAFIAVQVPLACNVTFGATALWMAFGMLGTTSGLFFAHLSQQFPPELSGRVNTASNLLIFVGAFAIQAGVGVILDRFPAAGPGLAGHAPAGHAAALWVLLALQAAAFAWCVRTGPRAPARNS